MKLITLTNVLQLAKKADVFLESPMYTKDGKYKVLKEDVQFLLSNSKVLIIKKGFYWDENSIPWLFQFIFPKSGIYAVPALVHDALYYNTTPTQKFADDEFKIWMKALDITPFQIKFRYTIVRLLGFTYWNKNVKNPSERCLHNRQLTKII